MKLSAPLARHSIMGSRFLYASLALLLLSILSIMIPSEGSAENASSSEFQRGPVNPPFLEWQKKIQAGEASGIVPSPFLYRNDPHSDDKLALPKRFDLRDSDRVSPVKSQGKCGACWAFTNCGLIEVCMKDEQGFFPDLSENHLIHHHGFLLEPCWGGSNDMALNYFTRWDGPLLEEDDPYDPDTGSSPREGAKPQALVLRASTFSTEEEIVQTAPLKAYLYQQGPLATDMLWDNDFYNASQNAYYSDIKEGYGHGITLIGWDDDKEIDGALGPGAWICKNSWGTKWGNEGFFYLSYYDTNSCKECMGLDEIAKPSEFGRIYMHDPFGALGTVGSKEGTRVYAANVFTALEDEEISALATFAVADGIHYTAAIHAGPVHAGALGTLLFETSGTLEQAGYHTIRLPEKVTINSGDSFTVVFSYQKDGETFVIPLEASVPGYAPAQGEAGQSHYSSNGISFMDMEELVRPGFHPTNACIRALTAPKAGQSPAIFQPADTNEDGFISIDEARYCTHGWQTKDVAMSSAIRALYLQRQGGSYD